MATFPRWCCVCLMAVALSACDVRVGEKGVSVGVAKGKASDQWTRSYTPGSGGQLEVINVNGAIEVSPSTGASVEVRIDREAEAGSDEAARQALDTVTIVESASADRIKVQVRRSDADGKSQWGRSRVAVTCRVQIPPGLNATFRTENGAVRIENVTGRITAATTNGQVNVSALSGGLTATAVNGAVQAGFTSVTDEVNLTAVNGGVRLALPSDVKADFTASAVNGNVSMDDSLRLTPSEEGASARTIGISRLTGTLNGGGPKITAQTTNGGVRVTSGSTAGSARGRGPRD